MLKFYVFRTSLFLNSVVYLFHVWHDDRCWSEILCSTMPNPIYDFKVKDTDLEFLYCNFLQFQFFLKPSMDFIHLWRDDRALSKILRRTIPIPVRGLKVKITEFFVFNYTPRKLCLWWGILFSHCLPSVRPSVGMSVCPSVTLWFFSNSLKTQ